MQFRNVLLMTEVPAISLVCDNVVITQNIGIFSYPYRRIDLHKLIFLVKVS